MSLTPQVHVSILLFLNKIKTQTIKVVTVQNYCWTQTGTTFIRHSRCCPFINRQVKLDKLNQTSPKVWAKIDGSKYMGPNRQVKIGRSKKSKYIGQHIWVNGDRSKQTGQKRQIQIDGSKNTGPKNGSKQTGPRRQNGPNISKLVKWQPKRRPNGSG